jgi:hypothetical protein
VLVRPTRRQDLRPGGDAGHARTARSWRGSFRDIAVALASAGVVALLVGYVVAGPSAKLTASVRAAVPRPGTSAFVLGRILEADGSGLEGANIEVRRSGRLAGRTVSDDAGAFQVELRGGCSAYVISLRARAQGSNVETVARRRLCPGDALPIDARVVTKGHFLWVPGPR